MSALLSGPLDAIERCDTKNSTGSEQFRFFPQFSGVLRLKKESTLKGVSEQFGVSGSGGTAEVPVQSRPISYSIHGGGAVGQGPSSPLSLTTTTNSAGSRAPSMSSPSPQPPPAHSHPFPTPPHRRAEGSEGANHKPASPGWVTTQSSFSTFALWTQFCSRFC